MKFFPVFFLLLASSSAAVASNCVVNLSHYDTMHPNFVMMREQGIIGVIHEATYPRFDRDSLYSSRQQTATRAGLLWGAYHFADASDPVRQADHFLRVVSTSWASTALEPRPAGILLVLDFEKNGHYPGGTMRPDQAVTFAERIRERTGRYPGLYGSENRLRAVLHASNVSETQRRVLSNCWLWIANYHWEPRATDPWSHWTMWQYTGDGKCDLRPRGAYPKGIANIPKAERNMFRGSSAAAVAFWQEHAWQPGGETGPKKE
jgi:lysozyme